ncbi:MAG: Ycf66 family protein [Cyanobacteria bacterium J06642_11]
MLANLLALIVGCGSLGFYLVAFILPEVHRRSDFFWSGVGLFYAVVLWYCARQMQGAVLLGQTASVGLVLWLGYQTLLLRRQTTPAAQQTPIWLGKTERNRPTSRPIAKDYEFVEDGVEDSVEPEEDPEALILIQPSADDFAPTMVVPAAMPKPAMEEAPPVAETPVAEPAKTVQKREKPNPIAAVGILVGWVKDVVTPKKKAVQPMVELPPRPPSIPKTDSAAEAADLKSPEEPSAAATTTDSAESAPIPAPKAPLDNLEPAVSQSVEAPPAAPPIEQDDEDSNWPDDEFWE